MFFYVLDQICQRMQDAGYVRSERQFCGLFLHTAPNYMAMYRARNIEHLGVSRRVTKRLKRSLKDVGALVPAHLRRDFDALVDEVTEAEKVSELLAR